MSALRRSHDYSNGVTVARSRKQAAAARVILLFALASAIASWFGGGIGRVIADSMRISSGVLAEVERRGGAAALRKVTEWQNLMTGYGNESDIQKLRRVNDFFNRQIRFVNDSVHWRKKDYWATPLETLSTGAGDCEDFSIAKYFTLRELGVPVDKMRITYVKALNLGQAHMVLGYYPSPGADPLILDNLIPDIRPGAQRTDLAPVYSFNGDGLWLSASRGQGKRAGSSSRIGHWRDLALRMGREHAR